MRVAATIRLSVMHDISEETSKVACQRHARPANSGGQQVFFLLSQATACTARRGTWSSVTRHRLDGADAVGR